MKQEETFNRKSGLYREVSKLEKQADQQEQYSRRIYLLVQGPKEVRVRQWMI